MTTDHIETQRRLFKVFHDSGSQSYVTAAYISEVLEVMASDGCTEVNRIDLVRDDALVAMGFGNEDGSAYTIIRKTAKEWASEYGTYIPCLISSRCHE